MFFFSANAEDNKNGEPYKNGAEREVVADFFADNLLTNEAAIRAVCEYQPTTARGIRDYIKKLLDKLGGKNNTLEKAVAMYNKALKDVAAKAQANAENRLKLPKTQQGRAQESGLKLPGTVQYSTEEWENANADNRVLDLLRKVENGEAKDDDSVDFGVVDGKTAKLIEGLTGINVKGFRVMLEARQLRHTMKDHGKNGKTDHSMADPNDVAKLYYAMQTAAEVRHGGKTNAYKEYRNGRNVSVQTVLYERPIGGKSYYVVEAVPDTQSKTLYIVSAFIGKPGYKKTSQFADALSPGTTPESAAVKSETKVTENKPEVKKDYSVDLDEDYLSTVESGDMDTAQKMVDEAAKAAGYPIKVWHGSRHLFNEFSRGERGKNTGTEASKRWFFAGDYDTANSYYPVGVIRELMKQFPKMYSQKDIDRMEKRGIAGKLYSLYLKMENPLEVDAAGYDYAAHREKADAFMEYVDQAEREGRDGIVLYNVRDNNLRPNEENSTVYMFRDPEQAKSADPVTYDDNDNEIPLSERFNSEDADIRFSVDADDEYRETPDTPALEKLGVKLASSKGRYDLSEQLLERDKAAKELMRATKKAEKKLNATKAEKEFAAGIAEGIYEERDIPKSMNKDKVTTLADRLACNGKGLALFHWR